MVDILSNGLQEDPEVGGTARDLWANSTGGEDWMEYANRVTFDAWIGEPVLPAMGIAGVIHLEFHLAGDVEAPPLAIDATIPRTHELDGDLAVHPMTLFGGGGPHGAVCCNAGNFAFTLGVEGDEVRQVDLAGDVPIEPLAIDGLEVKAVPFGGNIALPHPFHIAGGITRPHAFVGFPTFKRTGVAGHIKAYRKLIGHPVLRLEVDAGEEPARKLSSALAQGRFHVSGASKREEKLSFSRSLPRFSIANAERGIGNIVRYPLNSLSGSVALGDFLMDGSVGTEEEVIRSLSGIIQIHPTRPLGNTGISPVVTGSGGIVFDLPSIDGTIVRAAALAGDFGWSGLGLSSQNIHAGNADGDWGHPAIEVDGEVEKITKLSSVLPFAVLEIAGGTGPFPVVILSPTDSALTLPAFDISSEIVLTHFLEGNLEFSATFAGSAKTERPLTGYVAIPTIQIFGKLPRSGENDFTLYEVVLVEAVPGFPYKKITLRPLSLPRNKGRRIQLWGAIAIPPIAIAGECE